MKVFSKTFTPRETLLLCILGILVVAGAYLLCVQIPVTEGVEAAQNEASDLETQITVNTALAQDMDRMQKELDAILEEDPDAPVVPDYDNTKAMMSFLGSSVGMLRNYSFDTSSVSFPAEDDSSGIVRRSVHLNFTCDNYDQARSMVAKLEDCPYMCQIGELEITPEENTGDSNRTLTLKNGSVSVSLVITFFERMVAEA